MEKGRSELSRDERRIASIHWSTDNASLHVGSNGCAEIQAYDDLGPGDWMPYLAVIDERGTIRQRVPAWQVEVAYFLGGRYGKDEN